MTTPPIVSITDELIAELERDFSELTDPLEFGDKMVRKAQSVLALIAECAELKRDAERYRALRHSLSGQKQCSNTEMPCISDPISPFITYTPDGLDAAIDAAMQS
jgi:hypothetical protein